jgi:hypothetical protein
MTAAPTEAAEAIAEALAALPPSADDIAALFADLGIKGRVAQACKCPVAVYLGGELKDSDVEAWVSQFYVDIYPAKDYAADKAVVDLPPHIKTFVYRFDRGEYPHLEIR